jgi:hypothetical protein
MVVMDAVLGGLPREEKGEEDEDGESTMKVRGKLFEASCK